MIDDTFKQFIRKNFVSDSNIVRYGKVNDVKNWGVYSNYYFEMKKHPNYMQFIYNLINDIPDLYICECGKEMKFVSFQMGYTCSMGFRCKLRLAQRKKWEPTVEYLINILGESAPLNEIKDYIQFVKDFKISPGKHYIYIKTLKFFMENDIQCWSKRLYITKKAIEQGFIKNNDSTSLKSHMIRYGLKGKELYNKRIDVISNAHWNSCLQRHNGDVQKAKEAYDFENFKKGTSIEAFLYRCNGDYEKAQKLYNEYWINTTFSTSKESFKHLYGDEWESHYNEKRELHSNIAKNQWIYNPIKNNKLSEEELLKKKKKWCNAVAKAVSYNTQYEKLSNIGYEHDEIVEFLRRRWDNTSLKSFIEKYGPERGKLAFEARKEKHANTKSSLPYFIKHYGEIEGREKYTQYLSRKYNRNTAWKASAASLKVFFPLIDWLLDAEICTFDEICVGIPDSNEFWSKDSPRYYYDFTIPKLKICIEYNGEHVHPNPEWINEDPERWNTWRCLYTNKSADVVYEHNMKKINYIKNLGYKILIIWSENNDTTNYERCKKFIEEAFNDRM